ncbi:hypothetical protein A2U01_0088226, partial [Trifolium medium]|nr:hypothetical protein [Trifolium medium]
MLTGVDVPTLDALLPNIACFLETTYSHGLLNVNPHCPDQVLKLSNEELPMSSLSHAGY